jgi:glycosyltransferase involved in cell wall biosynthesis
MKVLIITFAFPPAYSVACVRVHNFVKYLPSHGIIPVVLTVKEKYNVAGIKTVRDTGLLKEYDHRVQILRTEILFGNILFYISKKLQTYAGNFPDTKSGNILVSFMKGLIKNLLIPDELRVVPASMGQVKEIFRENNIHAVMATAPPFSANLLGTIIAKMYRVPLVLDYRDLWNLDPRFTRSKLRVVINRRIESYTLKSAMKVIFTNLPAARAMIESFYLDPQKVVIIENGYDGEGIHRIVRSVKTNENKIVRINYIGSLTRLLTPEYFLEAVQKFLRAHVDVRMEIGFIGSVSQVHKTLVRDMGLDEIVRFSELVPKERALDIMCNTSDVLIVLVRKEEGGNTRIPCKIYEYLAAGKPIIVMDESGGATSEFMKSLGARYVLDYFDVEGIYHALEEIIFHPQQIGEDIKRLQSQISYYDRKNQAGRLATLLKQL